MKILGANHIQQYCANLPWHSNANITWLLVLRLQIAVLFWWFSSWISTSLKSSTWQMPPHSGNRSRPQLVGSCCGGFCMRTSITGFTWSVFFLCVAFCVVADALACSSRLKCARVWSWIRKCCVLVGLLCENWAVCLCLTAAFKQFSFVLFENNGWFLLFALCGNMMLLARKVCVLEQIGA